MGIVIQSTPAFTLIIGDKLAYKPNDRILYPHTIFSLLSPLRLPGTHDRGYLPALLRSRPVGEPGVMDQETAYLTLLRTVSSYEVTGEGIMNLKDLNGTAVLMYSS